MAEETSSDINPFNLFKENTGKDQVDAVATAAPTKSKIKFDPKDLYYDMSGDKLLVIFNHHTYKATRYYRNDPPTTRRGTDQDAKRLKEVFSDQLGFKVVSHRDKDYEDIWKILIKMREADYSALSCLCLVFLTHGARDGALYAADRPYPFRDVLKLFEDHPTLANKPKLFFVQACRGEKIDAGTAICIDGPEPEDATTFVIPSHADFLVMRSTVEDYRSYRDDRGSWMIQGLCKAVEEHRETLDLLQLVTMTHRRVAYYYSTYTPSNAATHDKKQIPETSFTLTKLLRF